MFIAHAPIAYILNESVQKKGISKLGRREQVLIAFFSLFFGILPDFDFFILLSSHVPTFQHHLYYLHSLVFWIPMWVLFYLCTLLIYNYLESRHRKIFSKQFLNILSITFFLGTLSHLLADLFVSYNAILYPLPNQVTVLGGIFHINFFTGYFFSVQFAVELIILGVFTYLILKRFFRSVIFSKIIKYLYIPLSIVYLIFSVYMNLNTYNKGFEVTNGSVMYDVDFDGIIDSKDMDTDNDGTNNLMDADIDIVKGNAKKILMEDVYTDSIHLFRYFGGMSSYRLVSQSYFEENKAIEPVLSDFYRKETDTYSYGLDYKYDEELYKYLNTLKPLVKYDEQTDISKFDLFFIISNEKIVNLGFIFDNDQVGTVLKSDIKTRLHSVEDVMDTYKGMDIYLFEY